MGDRLIDREHLIESAHFAERHLPPGPGEHARHREPVTRPVPEDGEGCPESVVMMGDQFGDASVRPAGDGAVRGQQASVGISAHQP